ncbi:MAG: DNA primase [Chloroflexi bacterium]|nr:DNA primase [Chloroflexota bacterium]
MSTIDDIKARLDIIDVVQSYTPLKKAGRSYKGLCPFHNEKTPSFVVFPDTQTWRCFCACGEGGDLFSFVMKAEGWDFSETLKVLAERAGVEIQPRTPQAQQKDEHREKLTRLLNSAAEFYMNLLLNDKAVRDYVKKRGLTDDTIREFGLGYAPDAWQTTLDHFAQIGYTTDDMLAAGLIIKSDSGRMYDRFRQRLMIPIHDARGNVVGFGARALADDQVPKYLNSPQGELFDKSQLLYGFHLARRDIRETETVVVVEGYMDVIQAHQAGYKNVVAQMGTALTPTQVQTLAKYANRLVMALDSDSAGVKATMRGLNVVHESLTGDNGEAAVTFDAHGMMSMSGHLKLDTRILRLPQGKDPDDFIRERPDEWGNLVNTSISLADYIINIVAKGLSPNSSIDERERAAKDVLPLLTATSNNDLYRTRNVQRLIMRLGLNQETIRLMGLAQQGQPKQKPKQGNERSTYSGGYQNRKGNRDVSPRFKQITDAPLANKIRTSPADELERYCLSILLQEPLWIYAADRKLRQLQLLADDDEMAIDALEPFTQDDFTRGDHRVLFQLIEKAGEQDALEPSEYIKQNLTPELQTLVDMVLPEPLENFHQRASEMHRTELKSVLRQNQKLVEDRLETGEFLRCVLEMRLTRIERATSELYFLDQDAETVDYKAIRGLARAKTLIQQALRDLR